VLKFGDLDFGDLRRTTAGCFDGLQRALFSAGFLVGRAFFDEKKTKRNETKRNLRDTKKENETKRNEKKLA